MTTYRLPDGARVESIDRTDTGVLHGASLTWINHPDLGPIAITIDKLTEVKPPLPPQPGDGAFAIIEVEAAVPEIFQRQNGEWWGIGECYQRIGRDWEELHERGKVTVLIRDPADAAPPLPWRDSGDTIEVADPAANDDTPLWVHIKSSWRSTAEARRLAALLLRAVREVEQR